MRLVTSIHTILICHTIITYKIIAARRLLSPIDKRLCGKGLATRDYVDLGNIGL